MSNVTKITKSGSGHGALFDRFTAQARNPHGAKSDESYGTKGRNPHGPQSDANYGRTGDDDFERQLAAASDDVKKLTAACPSCGHRHTLVDALRAARRGLTGKSRRDVGVDVRKADEAFIRSGAGEPDDLHEALVASIQKTYGIRR